MNKIKLTNNYNLLISRKVTKKEILNFIENKLGKKVAYCIDGATGSCTLNIKQYIKLLKNFNKIYYLLSFIKLTRMFYEWR